MIPANLHFDFDQEMDTVNSLRHFGSSELQKYAL